MWNGGLSALAETAKRRESGKSTLQTYSSGPREEGEGLRKTRPLRLRWTTPWARPAPPVRPRRHHRCIIAQTIVGRASCLMIQVVKAPRVGAYRARARIVLPFLFAGLVAACSGERTEDRPGTENSSTPPIAMPPPIVASHSYRCADGQILYVDILQDGLSMMVRRSPDGPALRLSAAAQGQIFLGERMNITLSGKELALEETNRKPIMCKRG